MTKTYKLSGLDCAHCAQKLEGLINNVEGVESAKINFTLQKLALTLKEESAMEEVMDIISNFEDGISVKEI